MKVLAAAIGLCALAIQTPARSQATLPQAVQDAVDTVRKECLPETFEQSPGFMATRDINGDKRPDYILDYGKAKCGDATSFYCGTGGCLTQVFASRDDGTYGLVLDENVRRLRFARVQGRPAILLDLHGTACGRSGADPCAATLYWNGYVFHPAN